MMKVNLYNKIQRIKNWFHPRGVVVPVEHNAADDAELLSCLCDEVLNLRARNGRHYWYYFPTNAEKLDVVKYLLNRNGVHPKVHFSYYCAYGNLGRLSLRLRTWYFLRNPNVKKFVDSINNKVAASPSVLEQKIATIRSEMGQRQK